MTLQDNVAVGSLVRTCFDLFEGEPVLCGFSESQRQRFWRYMIKLCQEQLPKEEQAEKSHKMTITESKRFGRELVPFGEFRGKPVDEVPFDRLAWYADQHWVDELRRYLKSDRVKAEDSDE